MNRKEKPLTLKERTLKAGIWVSGGHVSHQLIRLAGNLIMTRLLVPEMFGVMALANVLLLGMKFLSDFGLQQNIVQSRKGNDPAFLNTAWTIQIIRGVFITLITILLAFVLLQLQKNYWFTDQTVYSNPILPGVIAVLSLTALISGFNSTKIATANRDLAMTRIISIELISQSVGLACMISWAMVDRSIWALLAGAICASLVYMLLSHQILPGIKNKLHWDGNLFWEIFHFGKWIFISSIIAYSTSALDTLLLSGLVDANTMGMYMIASLLVSAIWQIFQKIIGRVAFPAISEVARERPTNLKRVYYKFRLPVDLLSLIAAGMLFSSGDLIVKLLYDERYHNAGYMLEILGLVIFNVRFLLAEQCFMALGMPKLFIPPMLVRLFMLIMLIPVVFDSFGITGAIWAVSLSALTSVPVIIYFKYKYELLDIKRELLVLPIIFAGYFMGTVIERVILTF